VMLGKPSDLTSSWNKLLFDNSIQAVVALLTVL
jgi:hypothetical protein